MGLAVLAGMALWAILSIVALAADCSVPGYIRGDSAKCSHQVCSGVLVTGLYVLTNAVSSVATDHSL